MDLSNRIWDIADGVPLTLENMTIRTTESGKLLVTGLSSAVNLTNISKSLVLNELNDLKNNFADLVLEYGDLKNLIEINDLEIEYHIAFDDTGKTGIGICSEINGTINWYLE